ncbi:MAG TPA: hypothetical protein PKA00_08780 [Saprospiraceae bacterium]|nr:hypothetical protein [Saprospiraceae bacterium]HMQ82989.1 hypothetical protein [Saprospiraceae bacterium]
MNLRIKKTFASAYIKHFAVSTGFVNSYIPKAGDAAVFRVIDGDSKYIKDQSGNTQYIFNDDLILGVFGSRYATNQFEAYVPDTPVQYCDLVSRGGVVGWVKSTNKRFKDREVKLEMVGYAVDEKDQVINTIHWDKMRPFEPNFIWPKVILSIGASMDSGKTTTAAYLCGGLQKAGHRVAYLKITGTAFPKDAQFALDRGADYSADFTLLGFPSTYLLDIHELLSIYQVLVMAAVKNIAPDYIVVEIADGLLQRETNMLLTNSAFMSTISDVVLSCVDSLSVLSGVNILENMGVRVTALSGLFTASDLLVRELDQSIRTPIFNIEELLAGDCIPLLNRFSPTLMPAFLADRA